jgi:mannan endo-1,4-beta-mannosidase
MRSRLVLLVAIVIAIASVVFAITRLASSAPSTPPIAHATLPPTSHSYLGVFTSGSPPSYDPIASFAHIAGKEPNLIGYYSGWAEPFATSFADKVRSHGVTPFVQIDPSFASVPAIAAGDYDTYLKSYAQSVREFGHAVVIGFGHEMNASWYPWGYKHVAPKTFVQAWRHIVNLFREQGAENVTWLWTINQVNQDRPGTKPVADWWPGASYVTWVGIDGYYYRPSDTFTHVFGTTIDQVRTFTDKPVLLSETAVGPGANQFAGIPNLFRGMQKYRTLGLVWFDKAQHGSLLKQDWRLEDNVSAQAIFRLEVSTLTLARAGT